jgi:hypothetical protein
MAQGRPSGASGDTIMTLPRATGPIGSLNLFEVAAALKTTRGCPEELIRTTYRMVMARIFQSPNCPPLPKGKTVAGEIEASMPAFLDLVRNSKPIATARAIQILEYIGIRCFDTGDVEDMKEGERLWQDPRWDHIGPVETKH